ncbi:MAG: hypothetical protein AB7N76_29925 [Planctomycetota bacterium]
MAPPRRHPEPLQAFAAFFAATWVVQAITCTYGFSLGDPALGNYRHFTFNVSTPFAIALAALAVHSYGLLGPRWRSRAFLALLAAALPGALSTALAAGLLDLEAVRRGAQGAGLLAVLALALRSLFRWGRELDELARRARLCATLVGTIVLGLVLSRGLAAWLEPPGGWPTNVTGLRAGRVPLALVSTAEASALLTATLIGGVSSLILFFYLPGSFLRAAELLRSERVLAPDPDALWLDPRPRDVRRGLASLLAIGLGGTTALVATILLAPPLVVLPGWPLAALPWVVGALYAERWLGAALPVAVSPTGILADNRREPWGSFTSWDARGDRFVLHGPGGARVLPLDEADPRRVTVEAWIAAAGLPRTGG